MEPPRESALSPREREARRIRWVASAPSWYNGHVHFAAPSLFGLTVIVLSIVWLRDLRAVELSTVPLVYLMANAIEWRAHRDLLHHRHPLAPVLYDRHTPMHHILYITEDMSVRSVAEWRLVLIPSYGIMLIFLINAPIGLGLWFLGLHNVALLYIATAVGYVVSYEWLHLAYHQPPESFVGRLALVRVLRKHHAIHHDPRLMQRYNFNVTVPLWDLVRRTYVSKTSRQSTLA